MDPITGAALITGGGALLGGMMTNASNAKTAGKMMEFEAWQASANRDFQSREAATNRAFQADLSGSAHQREVADLKAAGLNPILSGTGGMGSSTPSGSMPSGGQGKAAGFPAVDAVGNAVSSAMAGRRNLAEVKNIEMDTNLKLEQKRAWHETIYHNYQLGKRTETEYQSEMERLDALKDARHGQRTEAEIDKSKYGAALRYMDRTGTTARSLGSVLNSLKR